MANGLLRRWFGRSPRPNVLWLCADDFTPDFFGAYGAAGARTPHLDGLAASGVRFDRAYCNCPLSTPSRQSFWTGRYPRSIGVNRPGTPLPADEETLPAMLRRAGYETAAFGKTHYYAPRRDEFDAYRDWGDYTEWLAGRPAAPLPPGVPVLGPWRPFFDPARVTPPSMPRCTARTSRGTPPTTSRPRSRAPSSST